MVRLLMREKAYGLSNVTFFWICFVLMAVCWSPYLLSFAPGSVLGDSFSSIMQVEGLAPWSNHYPVLYSLIVGVFIKIGTVFFGSYEIGILLYSLFQSAVMISAFSLIVMFFYKKKVRLWFIVTALAYYCLAPFFPAYGITLWKDPYFSIAVVAMGALLYKSSLRNGNLGWRSTILLLIASFFCIFLRNNGIFIVSFAIVWLLILYKRQALRLASQLLALVIAALIIIDSVFGMMGIQKDSVESYGVPMQQIARVVATDSESLTDDQKVKLNRFLPLDAWSSAYSPTIVDSIKWNAQFDTVYFNEHEREFVSLWLELLPKHVGEYTEAYLLNTMGFWNPFLQDRYGYVDLYVAPNSLGIESHDILGSVTGFSLASTLESFPPCIGSGALALVAVISLALSGAMNKKKGVSLFYLPSMTCWLTILIATPVAFSLRYVYPFVILLPVFLFFPAYLCSKNEDDAKQM